MPYEYHAKVKNVVDGDTIEVDIDLGFDVILSSKKIRLVGLDTPESRTSDKIEKIFGLASKDFVKKFIESCKDRWIIVKTYIEENPNEKYGRLLGEIINPENKVSLNEQLINLGYAVGYQGENKSTTKEEHLKNRKRLIDEGVVKLSYKDAGIL